MGDAQGPGQFADRGRTRQGQLVQHAKPALLELQATGRIDAGAVAIDPFGQPSQTGPQRPAAVRPAVVARGSIIIGGAVLGHWPQIAARPPVANDKARGCWCPNPCA